ncbi:hypothetical protein E2C01_057412 [Portunus trituberculatus]|uniref:Uncharacterized protein n=1 Tax=Portunus trituberculatus TaxID=210409 RepID=A0A5B7H0Z7_PORTR|nr:hypothetical protein [Portunus trituberculatus]
MLVASIVTHKRKLQQRKASRGVAVRWQAVVTRLLWGPDKAYRPARDAAQLPTLSPAGNGDYEIPSPRWKRVKRTLGHW